MSKKAKLDTNCIEVQMKTGILETIAKSIYSDPKVKIREAVANSLDNNATWFIIYADRPSRNITLIDNGTGISRKRFGEIFDNIGYGMQRRNLYSNSYFGLGLLSILAFGQSAKIISRSSSERQVIKLEIDSQKIFSEEMRDKPISDVSRLLTLKDSSVSERERLSILDDAELKKLVGDFPETFTEIVLENIDQTVFEQVISEDFVKEIRKLLPLKVQTNEPFLASIKDAKTLEWLIDTMNNNDFCPTIHIYFGISGGEKELTPLWKYFPNFRKDLEIGAADIIYGSSKNNLDDGKPRFMYYYLYSTDDLEERTKTNMETGFWVRNKNFLIKEADYFQKPGTGRKAIIHEPLKNWLFGEIFHRDMTRFLIVTRNEYVWESSDFDNFYKEISDLVHDLNRDLRAVWKNSKEVVDSVINPFIEITEEANPFYRVYDTLLKIGIIDNPGENEIILDKLSQRRNPALENSQRIDNLIKKLRQDIVLADDENMKVIIDHKIGPPTKYVKHREEGTSRIIVRISPDIFAPVKVIFLGKTFDVFYVAAKESSPGMSIDRANYKIYINPFNQDISHYSLSFIEIYIAVELAYICSKTKEEMKIYLLNLLGSKLIKPEINPKKYLFSLKDELQRRRSA
jgi:hypothetical protein